MKNKGITLISLVIMIIILIILASITTYSGVSTIKSSKFTKFGTELEIMQAQVNLLYEKYTTALDEEKEQYLNMGEELTDTEEENKSFEGAGETDKSGYRCYTKEILECIDTNGLEYEYLVNVKERKVIALGGFEYERTKYYTLAQVKGETANIGGLEREDVKFSVNFVEKNKNGWEIEISGIEFTKYVGKGKIQYKKSDSDTWRTLEDLAVKQNYNFTIKESGKYKIRVTDAAGKYAEKEIYLGMEIGDYLYYDPTDELPSTAITTYTSPTNKTGHTIDQTFTITGSYDTSKYSWRILDISDDGTISIISEDIIQPINGGITENGINYYKLFGKSGYQNGCEELDKICEIYGNGYGAIDSRCIKIEDMNKIVGFNPNNIGGKKYDEGLINEYGNYVTYYWDGTNYPYYTTTNGLSGNVITSHINGFGYLAETWKKSLKSTTATTSNKEKIVTIKCDFYAYNPEELISNTSKEYNVLFVNKNGGKMNFWTSNKYTYAYERNTGCGIEYVTNGVLWGTYLYFSFDYEEGFYYGIRPVVTLKSDIRLTGSSEEGWTIVK